jgi:hypothetical protein
MTRPPTTVTGRPWSRGRLLLLLGTVVTAAVVVVAGLGLLAYASLTTPLPPAPATTAASGSPSGQALRDALAAALMLAVTDADSRGGTPAATPAPGIVVPDSTLIGPTRVPSGFPHTPEGAIGQLAAIEIAVLSQMSVAGTGEVYRRWAMPEAPMLEQWPLLRHVQSFLAGARMGPAKDPTTTIRLDPAGAQVKATDGPDWTIACVLLDATVTIRTQARTGFGYCERMQWDPASDRWLIGPGTPPALAPSTWPGTQLAQAAGWLTWTTP